MIIPPSLLHIISYYICINSLLKEIANVHDHGPNKDHFFLYNPIEQQKIIAFLIAKGEDPYAENILGHTFFDIKNICFDLLIGTHCGQA